MDGFYEVDQQLRLSSLNDLALGLASEFAGREMTLEAMVGKQVWEAMPDTRGTVLEERFRQAQRERVVQVFEYRYPGTERWFAVGVVPVQNGLSILFQEITEHKLVAHEREQRARQQAVVAELGLHALSHSGLDALLTEAAELVALSLDVEATAIAEVLPDSGRLLLRAGHGWDEWEVGAESVPGGRSSFLGYTVSVGAPVVTQDLAGDERFELAPLLARRNFASAAAVTVEGWHGTVGVLAAFAPSPRPFAESDVSFLQAVANALATAVAADESERRLAGARDAERRGVASRLEDEALRALAGALDHARRMGAGPGGMDAQLRELVSALELVQRQLRESVYDLRLEEHEQLSLGELMGKLAAHYRSLDTGPAVTVELADGVPHVLLGRGGVELMRLVGSAVACVKERGAVAAISVRVGVARGRVVATVAGDAQPPPPDAVRLEVARLEARAAAMECGFGVSTDEATLRIDTELPDEPAGGPVRVLVVEDHAAVREAVAVMFSREPDLEVVAQAASLAEARAQLDDVDVAVIDLGLPDGYGGELIPELRAVNSRAQALVLSATLDREEVAQAVNCGAAGALSKIAHLDEIATAVRRIWSGETLLPVGEVVELLRLAGRQREQEWADRAALDSLTPRELEVLQLLAEGLDSASIARRLVITVRTQRNHVANILAKLAVHSQLQAVVFAARHGVVEIR